MTTSSKMIPVILFVFLLAIPTTRLFGQSGTSGDVTGVVTDSTGAVIAGATVTIKSASMGESHSATTGSTGGYRFALLQPGDYTLSAEAKSFSKAEARITVLVGQAIAVNLKLPAAGAKTEVTVTADALLVNTESAEMSTTFTAAQIENLPNGGNDLTYVAQTAPGVVMNTAGGYGNFNANGLPATSNVFTVDGNNAMDPFLNLNNSGPTNLMLGKNSIAEASVVTNAYSGQYGQQAGAQVNYVSKSGTNSFHGNAQYQWSGRAMDANDWFNNRGGSGAYPGAPVDRPFANNNQWAASFGGPIKKDKTFFFLDTEGIRYIVPSSMPVYSPSPAFLSDTITNLQGMEGSGVTPATISTYQTAAKIWEAAPNYTNGSVIPDSCVDPYSGGNADPNLPGCIQQYQTSVGLPADEWLLIGRFDQNVGNNDRVFLRFVIDIGTQATYADPISPSFSAASYQPAYNNTLAWTHSFGAKATNQFIAGLDYYRAIFNEETNGTNGTGSTTGQPSPFPYSLYLASTSPVTGLNAQNYFYPQGRNVTQYQFIDDYALTEGKHSLKFGANFRRYDLSNYDNAVESTPYVLAGLQDFFAGSATQYAQTNAIHPRSPLNTGGFGVYAQDEWAITQRLKLTLGLRAEHNFNPTCDDNCFSLLNGSFAQVSANQGVPDPVTGLPTTPYNQALLTGRRSAFNSVDAVDLAPRLGFTWSPSSGGKTVISGGFGIFYDAFPAVITDSFVNLPYLVPVNLNGPDFGGASVYWGDPAGAAATVLTTANTVRNGNAALGIPSLANGLTASQLIAAGGAVPSVTSFPGRLKTPQYQEWNFGIQQTLDAKSSLLINYVGNHGIYEGYPNATLNACSYTGVAGYASSAFCNEGLAGSVDARFGTVTEWYSGAVSNYNGMTVAYNRHMTAGFVVQANFTWGHAMDEISNGGLLPYGGSSYQGQISPLSFRADNYGNADYDIRHSFNASYVWTEPFKFGNSIVRGILGGWIVSENFIARTGLPFTVTDGTAGLNFGGTAVPAQILTAGQTNCENGNSQCVNPANFTGANSISYFPTQTRNEYRGPGFFDTDLTISKDFHLTEAIKLNIGANFYNILNHQSFYNPNSVWTGSACGAGVPNPSNGQNPVAGMCTLTSLGQIQAVTAPPTGIYGSFGSGLPDGRIVQLQAKLTF